MNLSVSPDEGDHDGSRGTAAANGVDPGRGGLADDDGGSDPAPRELSDEEAAHLLKLARRSNGSRGSREAIRPRSGGCVPVGPRTLCANAPDSRRVLAEAIFERIEVTGLELARVFPTDRAVQTGLAQAFRARTAGSGRGERICASMSDESTVVRFVRRSGSEPDAKSA